MLSLYSPDRCKAQCTSAPDVMEILRRRLSIHPAFASSVIVRGNHSLYFKADTVGSRTNRRVLYFAVFGRNITSLNTFCHEDLSTGNKTTIFSTSSHSSRSDTVSPGRIQKCKVPIHVGIGLFAEVKRGIERGRFLPLPLDRFVLLEYTVV